jgi:mannan endo-1,4-beta-mannosidase
MNHDLFLFEDNFNRNFALNSIPAIAKTGANSIRIQWRINLQGGLNTAHLDKVIQVSINNKLVPIVQLHDATGSSDPKTLENCATWFKNNVALLNKYKKYLIVNIANEWVFFKMSFMFLMLTNLLSLT